MFTAVKYDINAHRKKTMWQLENYIFCVEYLILIYFLYIILFQRQSLQTQPQHQAPQVRLELPPLLQQQVRIKKS